MKFILEPLWSSDEVTHLTGGHSSRPWKAHRVCIALKDIKPGDLFFALPGDNLHDVKARGAAAAVITPMMRAPNDLPVLVVPDVYAALRSLASAARFRTQAMVIGVQSNAVKNSMAMYLGEAGSVYTGGRHLSQSLANIPACHDFALLGMAPDVKPDVAVITDTAAARQSMIFENLDRSTILLISSAGEDTKEVVARAKAAGFETVLTFGHDGNEDVTITRVLNGHDGRRLDVSVMGERQSITLRPEHHFSTVALGCAGIFWAFGMPLWQALIALNNKSFYNPALPTAEARKLHLLEQSQVAVTIAHVKNIIDWGRRRTAVLEGVKGLQGALAMPAAAHNMPRRIPALDILYTSKMLTALPRAGYEKMALGPVKFADIDSSVIVPGDMVIFSHQQPRNAPAQFLKAMRIIPA